jgi:hypothetical protein
VIALLFEVTVAVLTISFGVKFLRMARILGNRASARITYVQVALACSPLVLHWWVPSWYRYVAAFGVAALAIGWAGWSARQRRRRREGTKAA